MLTVCSRFGHKKYAIWSKKIFAFQLLLLNGNSCLERYSTLTVLTHCYRVSSLSFRSFFRKVIFFAGIPSASGWHIRQTLKRCLRNGNGSPHNGQTNFVFHPQTFKKQSFGSFLTACFSFRKMDIEQRPLLAMID